jgi:hypothetical protein
LQARWNKSDTSIKSTTGGIMMFKSILLTALLLSTSISNARSPYPDQEITSVTVTEVECLLPTEDSSSSSAAIGEIITAIDGIMAIGEKIWKIVEAGRPVVSAKFSPGVSVIPHIEGENPTLNQMSNWSIPISKSYRVSFKNNNNSELVGFTYSIYFQANGSYKGNGKYLANVKVDASEINVSWLYNFDASSELIGVANVGTDTAPIASAIMKISYAVKGPFNVIQSFQRFYIDGLGRIQILP